MALINAVQVYCYEDTRIIKAFPQILKVRPGVSGSIAPVLTHGNCPHRFCTTKIVSRTRRLSIGIRRVPSRKEDSISWTRLSHLWRYVPPLSHDFVSVDFGISSPSSYKNKKAKKRMSENWFTLDAIVRSLPGDVFSFFARSGMKLRWEVKIYVPIVYRTDYTPCQHSVINTGSHHEQYCIRTIHDAQHTSYISNTSDKTKDGEGRQDKGIRAQGAGTKHTD